MDVNVRRFWLDLSEELRHHIEVADPNGSSVLADEQAQTKKNLTGHTSRPQIDQKTINVRLQTVLRAVKRALNPTTIGSTQEAIDYATRLRALL